MDITYLQILGAVFIYLGGYALVKGEIEWSFEVSPGTRGRGGIHFDLTPDSLKYKKSGVYSGKLLRPVAIILCLAGILLVFVFPGENVAFSL